MLLKVGESLKFILNKRYQQIIKLLAIKCHLSGKDESYGIQGVKVIEYCSWYGPEISLLTRKYIHNFIRCSDNRQYFLSEP